MGEGGGGDGGGRGGGDGGERGGGARQIERFNKNLHKCKTCTLLSRGSERMGGAQGGAQGGSGGSEVGGSGGVCLTNVLDSFMLQVFYVVPSRNKGRKILVNLAQVRTHQDDRWWAEPPVCGGDDISLSGLLVVFLYNRNSLSVKMKGLFVGKERTEVRKSQSRSLGQTKEKNVPTSGPVGVLEFVSITVKYMNMVACSSTRSTLKPLQ